MHVIRNVTLFSLVSAAMELWLVNSTFYWDFITWLPWRSKPKGSASIKFLTRSEAIVAAIVQEQIRS
jgi:hypothetical protein